MLKTTPVYPRPDDDSLSSAINEMLALIEHFGPETPILDSILVRAAIERGINTRVAMWAIHELIQRGIILAMPLGKRWPDDLVMDFNLPAGIAIAKGGNLPFGPKGKSSWGDMAFVIQHQHITELSKSGNLPVARSKRSVGRPSKDQPRITINARMFAEMTRNPACENWSLRTWAEKLGCTTSAIVKTAAWKLIMKNRASEMNSRKSRTPRRYEE